MNFSIIPAAGLATRFLPASKCVPKELFPIFDKPAVQYIVEESVDAGIPSVVFVTGAGKDSILDHFDRINPKFPLSKLKGDVLKNIDKLDSLVEVVSVRQKDPDGLGHAVLKGAVAVNNESFAVMLPDMIIYPTGNVSSMKKMVNLHEKTGLSVIALMKVPPEKKNAYGIVEGNPVEKNIIEITKMLEKPSADETDSNLAIVGRYIFTPEIVNILKNTVRGRGGEIQLTDAMCGLMKKEKVLGMVIDDDSLIFDTGSPEGFAMANLFMATRKTNDFGDLAVEMINKFRNRK